MLIRIIQDVDVSQSAGGECLIGIITCERERSIFVCHFEHLSPLMKLAFGFLFILALH